MDPLLATAVERAVERVEPRLKLAGGYPQRYREAVAHALDYVRDLATRVPGPIDLGRESFARDPTVHALFGSVDEVKAAMCMSQAMRDYTRDHPLAEEVFALMGMRRHERGAFGMEIQGEVLRREVPQTLVYFSDHTIAVPAVSEADARERVAWDLFDSLLFHVAERVSARRHEKDALEREKAEAVARWHAGGPDAQAARCHLDELVARQGRLLAGLDLRRLGEDFDAVLLNPAQYVRLDWTRMCLDGMGVLRRPDEMVDAHPVAFADLHGRDRRQWTVILVHCRGIEHESLAARLEQAHRWLAI